jgi:cell division protein FtsI/penicillin-binding protein 2
VRRSDLRTTSCRAGYPAGSRLFRRLFCSGLVPLVAALVNAADVNYIVIDVRTRQVVKQDWPDADKPIPVGSLVKPFTALASSGAFRVFTCNGAIDRCWLAKGHGQIAFRDALANSCNAYFLQLARDVDPHSLAVVAARYGIPPPDLDTSEARIGLGRDWQISPLALTRAYCELASRAAEPRVTEILTGMKLAAESGTASAIGRGALAKTGTAPCIAKRKHKGDGFTIVLEPAASPRIALLVRVHGVPGAEAAKSAALLLRQESHQ